MNIQQQTKFLKETWFVLSKINAEKVTAETGDPIHVVLHVKNQCRKSDSDLINPVSARDEPIFRAGIYRDCV